MEASRFDTLGYSLQGNVKTREGSQHVDRDAQFRYIATAVRRAQRRQQPTIRPQTMAVVSVTSPVATPWVVRRSG